LIISYHDSVIFTSDSRWLHPLFELDDFLSKNIYKASDLFLRDKIAGKAAACMIVRLGIRRCHIELISKRAIPVFEKAGVECTYDMVVEQIECRTEYLITDDMSVDDAWLFLRKRAGRVEGLPVVVENLIVRAESKIVIDNLNLTMAAGEQLLIYGSNGAGKTTLLKAMLGLVNPASGNVRVGEWTVGSREWMMNRQNTAYVHQENIKNTFPVSAGEVVSIGLAGTRMSSSEIAYKVELSMRRTGCFNLYRRSYHSLSGGEKQRVSLARCLCQSAKVLLLDEPTSFLDREGKDDLLVLLNELCINEAPTIIIVSHDPAWTEQFSWEKKELKGGRLC
jgi:ABC-type cobalamin/Fe3+-siderophores transport systems, ATPase components